MERVSKHVHNAMPPPSPAHLGALAWSGVWKMGRHLDVLNEVLTDLALRRKTRLLVMMPPRHGKSVFISQFFPVWYLGHHPDHRVLLTSYEAHFAADWGRKAREIMIQVGQQCFGEGVQSGAAAANHWDLAGRRGGMDTAGVGGPLTGKGADLLIVDDPVKNAEQASSETYRNRCWDWWVSTAFTRLEPGGVAVIIQTRWHEDDLAGRVLKNQAAQDWHVIRFSAVAEQVDELGRQPGEVLWPDRFSTQEVEKIRDTMPAYWWNALYQQQPTAQLSAWWPADYFEGEDLWFDQWPDDLQLKVMALDPSKGSGTTHSDYSAYVMLGVQTGGTIFVEADMSNTRTPHQMVQDGVELLIRFRPHVFKVEANAWQDLLAPIFAEAFKGRGLIDTEPGKIHNHVKKELRIESLEGLLRARQIRFRRTDDTERLVAQLREFPTGRHDDGPDALEMAVRTAKELWDGDEGESVSMLR